MHSGIEADVMNLLDKLIAYARSKNITTHSIGAAIIVFSGLYDSSPDLRNYIGQLFVGYPVVVTRIGEIMMNLSAGISLWRNYARSSSAAGTLAHANAIKSQPDAPTASQVDAATTK
jgi:hypothetical protein